VFTRIRGKLKPPINIYLQVINNLPADEFKIREIANHFYSFQAYDLAISAFLQGRKILNDNKPFYL